MTTPITTTAGDTDTQARRQASAAEELRLDRIRAVAVRYEGATLHSEVEGITDILELKSHAISEGWDANEFELNVMRASRSKPTNHAGRSRAVAAGAGEVIQAALLCRSGHEQLAEKALGAHVLEAAAPYRSASFLDICAAALTAEGITRPADRTAMIQAAIGTSSLSQALGGGLDKLVSATFREVASTWRSFAKVVPLSNFREHTVISPEHRGQLEELGELGEVSLGQMNEDTSNVRLATFAKMFGIGRQAIINDDLSIFDQVGGVFARQAARKLNDLVWQTIMDSTTYFTMGNGNLIADDFGIDGVTAAVLAMRKQRDAEGNDIDIIPGVLVVNPEDELAAIQLLQSDELSRDEAVDNLPKGNPLKSLTRLEIESRISNADKFVNADVDQWYLFAGPASAPVYVGFLDGIETPKIEQFGFDSDPRILAWQWRIYADFGVAMGEHRAGVKSTGA